ncbi:MAG: DUF4249 domain-containing protein [Saprospiraceae bacterium]|nr:DUF4249 domain-containing protein [Saprospiraceae bacterium]
MFLFKRVFFAIMTLVLLASCEEDFLLTRPDFKPSVVVNCIFKDGKPWMVNLSYSRDILTTGSEINPITNAEVSVIEKSNGREIILKHINGGQYVSEIYPPQPDRTYELVVSVPGYDIVKAFSNAPKKANVVNIISDVVDKNITKVNFEIKDNISNYYIWNFISSNTKNPIDSSFNGNPKDLVSGINKYNNISGYLNGLSNTNDNDANSSGGVFTSNVSTVNPNDNEIENQGTTEVTKRYLRLLTASKDLYNYYKTVEKFASADNHNSSFSYTPEIYSNIQNGLGIFAGYTEEFKEIK